MKIYLSILFLVSLMLVGNLGNASLLDVSLIDKEKKTKVKYQGKKVTSNSECSADGVQSGSKDDGEEESDTEAVENKNSCKESKGPLTGIQILEKKAFLMAKYTDCPGVASLGPVSGVKVGWDTLYKIRAEIFEIFQSPMAVDRFYSENTDFESFNEEFTQFLENKNVDRSIDPLYSNEKFPKILLAEVRPIAVLVTGISICSVPTVSKSAFDLDTQTLSWKKGVRRIDIPKAGLNLFINNHSLGDVQKQEAYFIVAVHPFVRNLDFLDLDL